MRSILFLFFSLTILLYFQSCSYKSSDRHENPIRAHVAYFCSYDTVFEIFPVIPETTESISDLPDSLIIVPGFYKVDNKIYAFQNEGLHRISVYGALNIQRIVFHEDYMAYMSSLSWIFSHGNLDRTVDFNYLLEKAKTRKLYSTCYYISELAIYLLNGSGFSARMVMGITLDEHNEYDNGHNLVEVFDDELMKWIVFDLDNNCYFSSSDKPLSFIELIQKIDADEYKIVAISSDNKIQNPWTEESGEFDLTFILEYMFLDEQKLRNWYKRVLQVPLISDNEVYYYPDWYDSNNDERIISYSESFRKLGFSEYLNKLYAVPID